MATIRGKLLKAMQMAYQPLQDAPKTHIAAGHAFLLQAGLIRASAAGLFDIMPLGLRVLNRLNARIDESMESIGAARLSLPLLTPADLWNQSGRLASAGPGVFRVTDRANTQYILAPTHEEEITMVARSLIGHGVTFPLRLYQIGSKFRDEARPRAGMLRAREFVMKDLYTFDKTVEQAKATYEDVRGAYRKLFKSLGVPFVEALADAGNIGSGNSVTHEYHLLSDIGDDSVFRCKACSYAANSEAATASMSKDSTAVSTAASVLQTVKHRNALLGQQITHVYVGYFGDDEKDVRGILAVVPAGRQPNDLMVSKAAGAARVQKVDQVTPEEFIDDETMVVVDSALPMPPLIAKAIQAPIMNVHTGDTCPHCKSGLLTSSKGLEIAHTFMLGTKYSAALGLKFVDKVQQRVPVQMGCYGIGVSRLIAALAETRHDEFGLTWPNGLAPVDVVLVNTNVASVQAAQVAQQLVAAGYDVLWDDRVDLTAGARIRKAFLIGAPLVVVAGKSSLLPTPKVEFLTRHYLTTQTIQEVELSDVTSPIGQMMKAGLHLSNPTK